MSAMGMAEPAVSLNEAQAFLRIETGEEEAVVAGLIRSASALCEAFLGQVVIARTFTQVLPARTAWERLALSPIRSISGVEAIDESGTAIPLPSSAYGVDIDSSGDGWVRVTGAVPARRIRVSGTTGMAEDSNAVPEPIRQGVLRLVAHLFASRDAEGGAPPAAVTALWRPYRRTRLA
jgi:uncharacterized phiE125 gp8 family phage protein